MNLFEQKTAAFMHFNVKFGYRSNTKDTHDCSHSINSHRESLCTANNGLSRIKENHSITVNWSIWAKKADNTLTSDYPVHFYQSLKLKSLYLLESLIWLLPWYWTEIIYGRDNISSDCFGFFIRPTNVLYVCEWNEKDFMFNTFELNSSCQLAEKKQRNHSMRK